MNSPHRFGGQWTQAKLECLKDYLQAYMMIFEKNPKAAFFKTVYVDAFAGTGDRAGPEKQLGQLEFSDDEDAKSLLEGSARIALEIRYPFDEYVFVDVAPGHVLALERLKVSHADIAERIKIHRGEANSFLREWCGRQPWHNTRSVVFLDPYGMDVEWETLEAIAETRAIDLWLLFPLGPVNRLLTRKGPPPEMFSRVLTRLFGTEEWRETFYRTSLQRTIFGEEDLLRKDANFDAIGAFFVHRLKQVFAGVVERPLVLRNSKNTPIFLLCFAAANPDKSTLAVKIAGDLIEGMKSWPRKRKSSGRK